ncbi:MAG: sigma-70 family RNA polymerase sigma factor [Acidimicrobiales bacterium]
MTSASIIMAVFSPSTDPWIDTRAQLLAFVNRRVESVEVAEDIVQDVLERFQRTGADAVTNVQAWLYRSARNAIVDHYRKRRGGVAAADEGAAVGFDGGPESREPSSAVQELARCLRPLVEQLPDDYRTAVRLVDLEGHTHQAAAGLVGLSTSGMKSRVQRGRKRLASLLQDCCAVETTPTGQIVDYTPRQGVRTC